VNTKVRQVSVITNIANHLDAVINVVNEQIKKQSQVNAKTGGSVVHYVKDAILSTPTKKALKEWDMKGFTGYRMMVFLPSNAYIDYFAEVFKKQMPKLTTFILHGGLSQSKRTQTSEAFRTTDNCVLFTSDASARGVDYPDVTCVIQIGFDSRSEYLQRVGRTGRAGKPGTAYIITSPEENTGLEAVCDVLTEVHVERGLTASKLKCSNHPSSQIKTYRPSGVRFGMTSVPTAAAKQALRGWLGALASKWKRLKMSPEAVVNMAQQHSVALGLGEIPLDKLYDKLSIKIKKSAGMK
jgi:ATP-dependent RNA helicase MSS116